jgi:hypothetical protein
MRTFLKAAGFLKLNSYWFKGFRKPQVQAQNNVQVLPPVLICFFFADFVMKFPAAIGNSLIWVPADFSNSFGTHFQKN